ncbi:MAG: alpha/beta hydrolase-fold protein [Gammaproteobacteria bacterium]|nr:alpha/beta hydrolase-fold protein [Gammaproteobacteria bacterium]
MRLISMNLVLLAAFFMAGITGSNAQSIDLGRGEIPVTVPEGYDDSIPTPLIVALHGYTSNGPRIDSYMGFSRMADDYGYITVAPTAIREPEGDENTFWNASMACCNFYGVETNDVDYIISVIDDLKSKFNIDDRRVFLVGHSNGGFLSYRIAYEYPQVIAAIASLAGTMDQGPMDAPTATVHVLQIHGTADEVIRYGGGDIRDNRYTSAVGTVRHWAEFNGCVSEGRGREMRDLDASLPGYETGTLRFGVGCLPGGSAELWTIAAGAHSPVLSESYGEQVVEWLFAHPQPAS